MMMMMKQINLLNKSFQNSLKFKINKKKKNKKNN